MVCILDKQKALVHVLSFKNSNAAILSVEFRLFLHNLQLCYSCCGGSRISIQGHQGFKKKRQRKTGPTTISKDELAFSFIPVSHLSPFSLLKTIINIKLSRKY